MKSLVKIVFTFFLSVVVTASSLTSALAAENIADTQHIEATGVDGKISFVNTGDSSSAAIDENGNLWTWGENVHGNLGTGDNKDKYTPTKIMNGTKFKYVTINSMNCAAIDIEGNLWTCGFYPGLGDGSKESRKVLKKIAPGIKFVSVVMNDDSFLAIDENSELWWWGSSSYLGTDKPAKVMNGQKITKVDGGGLYGHEWGAMDDAGNIFIWDPYNTSYNSPENPLLMKPGTCFTDFSLDGRLPMLIDNEGNAWGWGYTKNTIDTIGPEEVIHLFVTEKFDKVSGRILVDKDGKIRKAEYGEALGSEISISAPISDEITAKVISSTGLSNMVIDSEGILWAWGTNDSGQLGIGTTSDAETPVKVTFTDSGSSESTKRIKVGNTSSLKAPKKVTKWESSDPSIVSVKQSGKKKAKITGISQGTATITAYSGKGNKQKVVKTWTIAVE